MDSSAAGGRCPRAFASCLHKHSARAELQRETTARRGRNLATVLESKSKPHDSTGWAEHKSRARLDLLPKSCGPTHHNVLTLHFPMWEVAVQFANANGKVIQVILLNREAALPAPTQRRGAGFAP